MTKQDEILQAQSIHKTEQLLQHIECVPDAHRERARQELTVALKLLRDGELRKAGEKMNALFASLPKA